MSIRIAKHSLNRTGSFSLQEKRHFRNVLDTVYADMNAIGELLTEAELTTPAGAGITDGTGTVYTSSVRTTTGDIPVITTRIFIDLTGLGTSTTDLDIIGTGTSAAHLGRITTAQNGIIYSGTLSCIETPATGADDIDLYAATVGTGKFDDLVTDLTETALVTSAGAWVAGVTKSLTGIPAANAYLYLTNGEAGTVGVYTAGKFILELKGSGL